MLAAALALYSLGSWAVQQPIPDSERGSAGTYWVGPESDDNCMQHDIQTSINNTANLEGFSEITIRVSGPASHHLGNTYSINLDNFQDVTHLRIVGGHTACHEGIDGVTVLDANSGTGFFVQDRLFNITYDANAGDPERIVRLENLRMQNGLVTEPEVGAPYDGGGIRVSGRQGRLSVQLRNSEVSNNAAHGRGGGIFVESTGPEIVDDANNPPPPLLFLDDDAIVRNNAAIGDFSDTFEGTGGGIHCEYGFGTPAFMHTLRTGNALISDNSAEHGGGLYIDGCPALIRSGGSYFFLPTIGFVFSGGIINNTAGNRGGGVHVTGDAYVTLSGAGGNDGWGGDLNSAAWILGNTATRGGGVYVWGQDARFNGFDLIVQDNTAEESGGSGGLGGGFYVGSQAEVNLSRWVFGPDAVTGPCEMDFDGFPPRCSRLMDNEAEDRGGAAFVFNGGHFFVRNTYFEGNRTESGFGEVIYALNNSSFGDDPFAYAELAHNNVVTGTEGDSTLMYASSGGAIDFDWSTVAGNDIADTSVFRSFAGSGRQSRVRTRGSIIWEEAGNVMTSGGTGQTMNIAECVISHQEDVDTAFGSSLYFSQIDPEFQDPENSNFRLGPTSPAINYCHDFYSPPDRDLDQNLRGQEYPDPVTTPPDSHDTGIEDIGAFVGVPALTGALFHDRFEAD